jgi:hypothetical protein
VGERRQAQRVRRGVEDDAGVCEARASWGEGLSEHVVYGGETAGEVGNEVRDVWRLSLATLTGEAMSAPKLEKRQVSFNP